MAGSTSRPLSTRYGDVGATPPTTARSSFIRVMSSVHSEPDLAVIWSTRRAHHSYGVPELWLWIRTALSVVHFRKIWSDESYQQNTQYHSSQRTLSSDATNYTGLLHGLTTRATFHAHHPSLGID